MPNDNENTLIVDDTTIVKIPENATKRITKTFSSDISIDEGERAVIAKISTIAVDRDGEVLLPMGCNFKDFEKNPIVCDSHRYNEDPVGKCVSIKRDDKGIIAKTIFTPRPENLPESEIWRPDILFHLYKHGVLNAWSVGIDPTSGYERRVPTKKDIENFGDTCRGVVSKWKMWEYSTCNIPANQEAVTLAVAKGILTPEMRVKMFGEPQALEAIENKVITVPEIEVKRVIFFMPGQQSIKPRLEKAVRRALAKAKGQIYLKE